MTRSVRERMVDSAVVLLAKRGFQGASFSEVLAHSKAPRGSIYHHFPDGKEQLIAAAVLSVKASDPCVPSDTPAVPSLLTNCVGLRTRSMAHASPPLPVL